MSRKKNQKKFTFCTNFDDILSVSFSIKSTDTMLQYQNVLLFIYILRNQLTSALASQTNVTNLATTNNYSNNQLICRFF